MPTGTMTVTVVKAIVPPSDKDPKQACVKVELRESKDNKQKHKTSVRALDEATNELTFGEAFEFLVSAELTGELRVQLFKKSESVMGGKAVVANAGIYVKNIVSHVLQHGAIDKQFKLFTKDGKAMGGAVHLIVAYEEDPPGPEATAAGSNDLRTNAEEGAPAASDKAEEAAAATKIQATWKGARARRDHRARRRGGAIGPGVAARLREANPAVLGAAGALALGVLAAALGGGRKRRGGERRRR